MSWKVYVQCCTSYDNAYRGVQNRSMWRQDNLLRTFVSQFFMQLLRLLWRHYFEGCDRLVDSFDRK